MTAPAYRLLNRDGSFNVVRLGLRRMLWVDLYHSMLAMRWRWFFACVLCAYLGVNLLFGAAYCWWGELEGAGRPGMGRFAESFFFSVQTLATIGYGRLSPAGFVANCLVTTEALVGLTGFGIVTGLLFARFSRPTSRVIFSRKALITPHDGVPSLIFRMVNARANQIVEATMRVVLVRIEKTAEGEEYRTLYDLKLERERTAIFAASWTVVHPIDRQSPLHGQDRSSLEKAEAEIMVSLLGTDETFAQTIHARYSYIPSEIVWNGSFEDMTSRSDSGAFVVDVRRLSDLRSGTDQ